MALLDEGGVVLFAPNEDDTRAWCGGDVIVFGHAIYESLAFGVAPAVVAGISLPVTPADAARMAMPGESGVVRTVDRLLAAAIDDESMLRSPRELRRLTIAATDATA
jgi:hypothetical protein